MTAKGLTEKKKILLVDDHALFRHGIKELLNREKDMVVVGEAENGMEALERTQQLHPDLVLMDMMMPHCDGATALKQIKATMPQVKVVMLTVCEDDDLLVQAIQHGADGCLLKNISLEGLIRSLRVAFSGETALSRSLTTKILQEFSQRAQPLPDNLKQPGDLTQREMEVLDLVVYGFTNKDIGERLDISGSTVKNHLHNIMRKLNMENRVQLTAYAFRENLGTKLDSAK